MWGVSGRPYIDTARVHSHRISGTFYAPVQCGYNHQIGFNYQIINSSGCNVKILTWVVLSVDAHGLGFSQQLGLGLYTNITNTISLVLVFV